MRSSRRRTLSHFEVENFLNEISAVKPVEPAKRLIVDELPNPVMKSLSSSSRKSKSAPMDETQLIREYCKIKCRSTNPTMFDWEEMRTLSRGINDKTSYKLMSSRLMMPEQFFHPIGSAESRKEIIMGLSPMLTEADVARKQETESCEKYTGCRSSKAAGKAGFEYIDLSTQQAVEFDEYERRYAMYIHEEKINRQQNYAVQSQTSVTFQRSSKSVPPVEVFVDKENLPPSVINSSTKAPLGETSLVQTPTSSAKIVKKRKHGLSASKPLLDDASMSVLDDFSDSSSLTSSSSSSKCRGASRRGTLSPGTVRKLLIENVEVTLSATTPRGANTSSALPFDDMAPQLDLVASVPSLSRRSSPMIVDMEPTIFTADVDPLPMEDMIVFDDVVPGDLSPGNHRLKNTQHSYHRGERRNTLSPSAARLAMLDALEDDEEESTDLSFPAEVADVPEMFLECLQPAVEVREEGVMDEDMGEVEAEVEAESELKIVIERDDGDDLCAASAEDYDAADLPSLLVVVTPAEGSSSEQNYSPRAQFSPRREVDMVIVDIMDEDAGDGSAATATNTVEVADDNVVAPVVPVSPVASSAPVIDDAESSVSFQEQKSPFGGADVLRMAASASPFGMSSGFFGRPSEGHMLRRGLNILDGESASPNKFESLESMVGATLRERGVISSPSHQIVSDERVTPVKQAFSAPTTPIAVSEGQSQQVVAASVEIESEVVEVAAPYLGDTIDQASWEAAASQRMKARFAEARWKYLWEIVSAHAANAAIRKFEDNDKADSDC